MILILALLACSPTTEAPECAPVVAADSALTESPPAESGPTETETTEPCTVQAWYQDCDADGIGQALDPTQGTTMVACEADLPATDSDRCVWVIYGGDCDDTTGNIRPLGTEICDLRDNDCDGYADEGFDTDGDGLADCNGPTVCP